MPKDAIVIWKKKTTQALAFHRFSISSFLCRNNNKIAGGIWVGAYHLSLTLQNPQHYLRQWRLHLQPL